MSGAAGDRAEAVYRRQSFGTPLGLGARPALLLIDFVEGFVDPEIFGGGNIASAAYRAIDLLALAREASWPVAHARIVFADDGADGNIFSRKVPGMLRLTESAPIGQFISGLAPHPGELVVRKRLPSAFRGTDLAGWLSARRIDSLVVGGCTTSGCVRASVIDAMAHGFMPLVVEDCVGDRAIGPHEANLFDIAQKCGDVLLFADLEKRVCGG